MAPKPTPESIQILDQDWTKKVIQKGDTPKMAPDLGLCSNLIFLAHSDDLLKICKAFTQFVNEPRFGQDGLKLPKMAPNWPQVGEDVVQMDQMKPKRPKSKNVQLHR